MTDQITVRDYRTSDLEAIFRLDEDCFSSAFRFNRESMRYFVERSRAVCLIAEGEGGDIAGFVIAQMERAGGEWRGYVVTLDVAPEFRRRGLARRLMLQVERRMAEDGAGRMDLHVFTGNDEAIRFYEQLGYERTAERRGFYGDGLDAFVYRKALSRD